MSNDEIKAAALKTIVRAIHRRFPPGAERDRWMQWAADLAAGKITDGPPLPFTRAFVRRRH